MSEFMATYGHRYYPDGHPRTATPDDYRLGAGFIESRAAEIDDPLKRRAWREYALAGRACGLTVTKFYDAMADIAADPDRLHRVKNAISRKIGMESFEDEREHRRFQDANRALAAQPRQLVPDGAGWTSVPVVNERHQTRGIDAATMAPIPAPLGGRAGRAS